MIEHSLGQTLVLNRHCLKAHTFSICMLSGNHLILAASFNGFYCHISGNSAVSLQLLLFAFSSLLQMTFLNRIWKHQHSHESQVWSLAYIHKLFARVILWLQAYLNAAIILPFAPAIIRAFQFCSLPSGQVSDINPLCPSNTGTQWSCSSHQHYIGDRRVHISTTPLFWE